MGNSSGSAGQIIVDLLLNKQKYDDGLSQAKTEAKSAARDISGELNNAGDSLDGVGSIAAKVGKMIAGAFTVKKIYEFSKQCLEVTSSLQEVQNVLNVTFGAKSASQIDNFAKSAAEAYGLSELMAKQYLGTFGAMAKGMGFSTDQAYAMSQTLTGLAGDVASFYNISQDEAFTKLKSVFTGETESLKSLGVVMTQANLDAYAMANGWGVASSQMDQASLTALRLAFVQDSLSAAAGDWARTSDSYANSTKALQLKWEEFENTLGVFFMQIAGPVIEGLSNIISEVNDFCKSIAVALHLMDEVKEEAADPLAGTADSASRIDDVLNDIKNTTVAVGGASKKAGRTAGRAAKDTGKAVTGLGKKMKTILGFDQINKLAEATKNASKAAKSAGFGGGGGGGLNISKAKKKAAQPAQAPAPAKKKNTYKEEAEDNKHNYVNASKVKITPKKNEEQIQRWSKVNIGPNYRKLDFRETQNANINAAKKDMTFGPNAAKIPKAATDTYAEDRAPYYGKINAPVKVDLKKQAKSLWKDVKKLFSGTNKKVKSDPSTDITAKGTVQMESAEDVNKKIDSVTSGIKDVKAKATISMPEKKDVSYGWKDRTSGVNDVKKKAKLDMSTTVKTGTIKKLINEQFIAKINTAMKLVKLFGSNPFKNINVIPKLAQGGYVKPNTPQLAMIGDNKRYGEIVAPENKLQAMANAAAGANNQQIIALLNAILRSINSIDTDAYMDGNKVTDVVLKNINARTKARGKSVVIT